MCSYNGKRGAVVFEAPGRIADNEHMAAWWTTRKQRNDGGAAHGHTPGDTRLSNIPTMADGTHVGFAAVVAINEHTITDMSGFTLGVTFKTPPTGRFIRIDDAKILKGELVVSTFTEITDHTLAVWWERHEDADLPHAREAPPSPVGEWPF